MNLGPKTMCIESSVRSFGDDARKIAHGGTQVFICTVVLLSLLLWLPESAGAQLVNGRLVSSLYSWEQFDTVGVSKTYARGMQSALFDIAQGNISLHTHLQVAGTLKKTLDEEPDFRAYYLYLKIRDIGDVVDLSLGRLPYFAGTGTGTVDGALAAFRMADNDVRVKLYGGARVPDELTLNGWNSLDRNFVLGGQVLTTVLSDARIGISYVNRQRERVPYWTLRPDSVFNPVDTYITPDALKEQYLGLDAQYDFPNLSLYGRYDYDLNRDQTQRGQITAQWTATEKLRLSGDFIHRAPRIAFNSFFAVFDAASVNEYELGGDYLVVSSWRAFARAALVDYTDDQSFRYTVGIAQTYGSLSYRGSSGYAGEQNSVSIQGSYPLLERKLIPTAALTYGSYKLNDSAPLDHALALAVGATVRPAQVISIDLQVQALSNKVLDSDVRFFGKFTYWFAETMSLFD